MVTNTCFGKSNKSYELRTGENHMNSMSNRPLLTKSLSNEIFLDHYWLKSELLTFCRAQGLSCQGSKIEVTERISEYLSTGLIKPHKKSKIPKVAMPDSFTLESIIEPGWKCNENLRTFFQQHLGNTFRFNSVVRYYILKNPGSRLGDVIEAYLLDKKSQSSNDIAPQFEYNRFVSEFSRKYPNATRKQILDAWQEYRNTPISLRTPI